MNLLFRSVAVEGNLCIYAEVADAAHQGGWKVEADVAPGNLPDWAHKGKRKYSTAFVSRPPLP